MPGLTELSEGSERISERLSFSSTKYGPSVSAGLTMHAGVATATDPAVGEAAAAGAWVAPAAVAMLVGARVAALVAVAAGAGAAVVAVEVAACAGALDA